MGVRYMGAPVVPEVEWLERGIPREPGRRAVFRCWEGRGHPGKAQHRDAGIQCVQQRQIARHQPRLHFSNDPPGQVQTAGSIQRHCDDSAQNASKECCHPLHRVVAPEQNPIPRLQAELVEAMSATGA